MGSTEGLQRALRPVPSPPGLSPRALLQDTQWPFLGLELTLPGKWPETRIWDKQRPLPGPHTHCAPGLFVWFPSTSGDPYESVSSAHGVHQGTPRGLQRSQKCKGGDLRASSTPPFLPTAHSGDLALQWRRNKWQSPSRVPGPPEASWASTETSFWTQVEHLPPGRHKDKPPLPQHVPGCRAPAQASACRGQAGQPSPLPSLLIHSFVTFSQPLPAACGR